MRAKTASSALRRARGRDVGRVRLSDAFEDQRYAAVFEAGFNDGCEPAGRFGDDRPVGGSFFDREAIDAVGRASARRLRSAPLYSRFSGRELLSRDFEAALRFHYERRLGSAAVRVVAKRNRGAVEAQRDGRLDLSAEPIG